MSFAATMYVINDDPRTLMKLIRPETAAEVTGIKPTGAVDLLNPTFELDYQEAYTTKNYIVVGAPFNRSYFITDMKIDIGKKIIISCSIDVLQTYNNQIADSYAYIIRTGRLASGARYLPDDQVPITTETQVQNYPFNSTPFLTIDGIDGNYVLTVIGGAT